MASPPKLLFISPVFPDVTGSGLAMRAGTILESFSTLCQVHLLIVPIQDLARVTLAPHLLGWSSQHRVIRFSRFRRGLLRAGEVMRGRRVPDEWRFATAHTVHQSAEAFQGIEFDFVHVSRLYMTPFAEPYLRIQKHLSACFLDLDDIESRTRRRLAQLYRANGLQRHSQRQEQASEFYERLERQILPQYNVIFVCSVEDKSQLAMRGFDKSAFILPNAVRPPAAPPRMNRRDSFNFLFVGNLSYYPNEDAVVYFLEQVLPLLRQRAKQPFRVTVAGSGGSKCLQRYASLPELHQLGFVDHLAPCYEQASAVIVPVRAGGGTRIKVLEAFGFKRPVVSTRIGVEGIAVENEKHVLLADTPEVFATQCCRLMEDSALWDTLVTHAHRCLIENYTPDVLRPRLERLLKDSRHNRQRLEP